MELKFLVMGISSLISMGLIIWHAVSFRGKKTAFYFFTTGILFGFFRAKIIYLVQVVGNESFIPYQYNNPALKIGNDSLQVYLGWLIVSYLAWCLAEYILKAFSKHLGAEDMSDRIFPIIAFSFLILTAFSYAIETASSSMHWWSWNPFLTAASEKSVFINVPLVGIVDWGTVAFEFLASFFLIRYAFIKKKWHYLAILILPLVHWTSHYNFSGLKFDIFGNFITPSLIVHWLLPVIPVILFTLKSPRLDEGLRLKKEGSLKAKIIIWTAFSINFILAFVCSALIGKDWPLLISMIPLALLALLTIRRYSFEPLLGFSAVIIPAAFFLPIDGLTKQRLLVSFYPLLFMAVFALTFQIKNLIANSEKITEYLRLFLPPVLGITALVVLSFLGLNASFTRTEKTASNKVPVTQNKASNPASGNNKVILIIIDTLRPDHLGAYGYSKPVSPNIDKFAKEATIFEKAYTPIPYTVPAHLSLMSGLYPKDFKVTDNTPANIQLSRKTLAEIFKENGYATAGFVGFEPLSQDPFKKGFDILDFENKQTEELPQNPAPDDKEMMRLAGERRQRSAQETNARAFQWLEANKDSSLFLWVHYYEPHSPYDSKRYKGTFSKDLAPTTKDLTGGHVTLFSSFDYRITPADIKFLESRYDEEIRSVDVDFGHLIKKIKDAGIYDESTIILASDHGENFDHDSVFHATNLYESAVRVPLIIKNPDFDMPPSVKEPVSLIDIYPSLNIALGLGNAEGGLTKNLFSTAPAANRDFYFETKYRQKLKEKKYYRKKAVLSGDMKLILSDSYKNAELYDLSDDELESKNIVSKENQEAITLIAKIKKFFPFSKSELSPGLLH